ncbi:MAG: hypothetical protein O3B04_02585 [Chloroflexi bacterium]|nr:hypothetical protein [Chloroflexota bacterium]MDA1296874.1 hypothetical protein [Chloroflexota bacterium]
MAIELSPNTRAFPYIRRFRSARLLLPLLSIALIAVVACGTDRAGDGAAAAPFQVDGDALTWTPQWQAGDSRTVTIESSAEYSPALQQHFDNLQSLGQQLPGGATTGLPDRQTAVAGTVSFISADSTGAKAQFDINFQEMLDLMNSGLMDQQEFGGSDLDQFESAMGFIEQLDLGVEFGLDSAGAHTGVTNMEELATTVQGFIDSFLALAAFSGESPLDPDDRAKMNSLLEALPDTEVARVFSAAALNAATANMFLMRSGEYTLGQPVAIAGNVPAAFGIETEGHATYELADISGGIATMTVEVSPGEVDVFALAEQFIIEIGAILGEDASEMLEGIANIASDERSMATALTGILFEPYTVTLTIDASTGWVTAADWSVVLALPEGFEDLIPEEERDFDGFNLSDFAVTMNMRATFE